MANICCVNCTIVGDNGQLEYLKKAFDEAELLEHSHWLGGLVKALGEKTTDVSCRGEVVGLDYIEGCMTLDIDFAWSYPDEIFDLINRKFPDLEIYFIAQEPGNGIYVTNDAEGKFYPDKVYVDACINGQFISEYFSEEQAALNWLTKQTNGKVRSKEDIELFMDDNEDSEEENFIYYHKFEIID